MADVFENEADIEPTISIGDYLKAVEEEELVSKFCAIYFVFFSEDLILIE